ncbi:DUF2997 domain-containing protein [Actinomyces slackii]|uniref:DUF2997 domain-containing protein n=1 Tax=Actinomyces slackii TaxID=52774 RepID=UPI0009FE3091|nr:DUF2997 domain-containing protein [Actinomyces slackii]
MSLTVTIVPLAAALFAAGKAISEGKARPAAQDPSQMYVQTRMSDPALLAGALRSLGLNCHWETSNNLRVSTRHRSAILARDNSSGVWVARFAEGWALDEAQSFIADLDHAYGLQVQDSVLRKLRARAPELGMRVEEQTRGHEQHVTLVLTDDRRVDMSVDSRGEVRAETVGFTGHSCLSQIPVLEKLVDGHATESSFTSAYAAQLQNITQENTVATRQN